jgi:hypothetical protein
LEIVSGARDRPTWASKASARRVEECGGSGERVVIDGPD